MTNDEIISRLNMLNGNLKAMRSEQVRLNHQLAEEEVNLQEHKKKVKEQKKLPYLVSNIVEVLDLDESYLEEGNTELDSDLYGEQKGKCVVIKTSRK